MAHTLLGKEVYLEELENLQKKMNSVVNTPYTMYTKVITLTTMNMRYEKVAVDLNLREHPYELTRRIIKDCQKMFDSFMDIAFIESDDKEPKGFKSHAKEEKHQELFNEIWTRYKADEFQEYVERYLYRLKINGINDIIKGRKCVDLGCGNGVTCFAMVESGASLAVGIDYGEKSIEYARNVAKDRGVADKTQFKTATVYETGYPDDTFDFAIQNGVFHHLDNENQAIEEAKRIIKPGGYFWYYTDGDGGIQYDLWDTSVDILKDVPTLYTEAILSSMNVRRNKIAHLSDGMGATYAHTSWDEITSRLAGFGFGHFKRLSGGYDTDCDLDRIEKDSYGKEKFGEGDLRILCRLDK